MSWVVGLSPIRHGFAPGFVNYKKGCTRLSAVSDKVYQLLAQGVSSTTKTGRYDIAEILLKVALSTKKSNQINRDVFCVKYVCIWCVTFKSSIELMFYLFDCFTGLS